jgi:iron complex outermembrane recepter protein
MPNARFVGRGRRALAFSIAVAISLSLQVHAQEEETLEEINITGSRIRATSGMTTPVPVTAVTLSELRDFAPEATVAEQLDQLPQFFQTATAQRGGVISGTSGGSFLNMRGMGGNRTLVLINGSRVVPNDRSSQVNVDVFPMALVRDIEVVTGGASAAYGADALTGVVNFVLDREFEGLKVSASSGISEFGDGHNWNASIAGGKRLGDRLHLIGSLEGRQIHMIDRDMTAASGQWNSFQRWGHVTNPAWRPTDPPGTNPQRLTLPNVHSTAHTPQGLINVPGSALNRHTFLEDGSGVRPFVLGDVVSLGGPGSTQSQSGGPEAFMADMSFPAGPTGNEVIQQSAFGAFKYDATDKLQFHGQLMLGDTQSNFYNRRGMPHLQTPWQATIYSGNPFLPASVQSIMDVERRGSIRVEKLGQPIGVNDFNFQEHDKNRFQMYSVAGGFEFDIDGNWRLNGSFEKGKTDRRSVVYDEVRLDRLFLAMDAVRHPQTGAIVCHVQLFNPTPAQLAASVANTVVRGQQGDLILPSPVGLDNSIRDCVPLNILGSGNASQAAIDYIKDDKIGVTVVRQEFAELLLTGDIHQGWGPGPISLATGLTWRESSFSQWFETNGEYHLDGPPVNVPALGIRGIAAGYNASTSHFMFGGVPVISGDFNVWEAFGELNVPVWESASGNQRLAVNFAGRTSDYSRSGSIQSWKAGINFDLHEDLRFRSTFSRDVREPSFSELFDFQGTAGQIEDPRLNGAIYQITLVNGGNPDLNPEQADTKTIGLVYQPSFAPWISGLQLSVDWYDIQIDGLVGSLGQQRIVNECHQSQLFCEQILRDPASGLVSRVDNVFLNINEARVRGIDMEAMYRTETNFFSGQNENFMIRMLAGYLQENSTTNFGASPVERAGAAGRPAWQVTASADYRVGPYGLQWRTRYYDAVLLNNLWVQGIDVDDNTIASNTVHNLAFSYNGETSNGGTWRLAFNVTNVFDKEPPRVASFNSRFGIQTVSNEYDVFGRRYQLTMNYNF